MPIFGFILAAILRSVGRIAAFLFGWAIVSFFGKMPVVKQYLLSSIAILSLAWWYFLTSALVPIVITLLISIQPQVAQQRNLIEIITWPAVAVLPILIGILTLFLETESSRSPGTKLKEVVQGYLIAPAFGIAIFLMVLIGAWLVIYKFVRQVKIEHIPIQIKPDGYDKVLQDLEHTLDREGYAITVKPLSWILRPPEFVLSALASSIFRGIAPKEPRQLVGKKDALTIIVHPSDIAISARGDSAIRARTVITTYIPFTDAYLTWEKSTQQVEDRLYNIWKEHREATLADVPAAMKEIDRLKGELYSKGVPFEQWAVLYRELLQLEEALIVTPVRSSGAEAAAQAIAEDASEHGVPHLRRSVAAFTRTALAFAQLFR